MDVVGTMLRSKWPTWAVLLVMAAGGTTIYQLPVKTTAPATTPAVAAHASTVTGRTSPRDSVTTVDPLMKDLAAAILNTRRARLGANAGDLALNVNLTTWATDSVGFMAQANAQPAGYTNVGPFFAAIPNDRMVVTKAADAASAVDSLIGSAATRPIVLSPGFTQVGISTDGSYWSFVFAP